MSINNPLVDPAELVMPRYERGEGVHNFAMHDDRTVSVISYPDWEGYAGALRENPSLGDVALSPELITLSGPVRETGSQRSDIEERVEEVSDYSADHPETTFVLGTATFDDEANGPRSGRPANSVLFVERGQVVAQANKRYPSRQVEKDIFRFQQGGELPRTVDPSVVALICADLIGEGGSDDTREMLLSGTGGTTPNELVGEDVRTVLLSSSWATPMADESKVDGPSLPDGRFRQSLETRVGKLFQSNPDLYRVIVADRIADDVSGINGPYNAQFTRKPYNIR